MPLNLWGNYQGLLGGRKVLNPTSLLGCVGLTTGNYGVTSTAWTLANVAIFQPTYLETDAWCRQLYVGNGATVSGNIDVGLYTMDGVKITSAGSTAQAGTSALQIFNVADIYLAAGWYYLAVALDNTTGTVLCTTTWTAAFGQLVGMAEMTAAFALPAQATLASYTRTLQPRVGLVGDAVL